MTAHNDVPDAPNNAQNREGDAKPINELPYNPGGLMRCCIETLRLDAGYAAEGQVVKCLYCTDSMVLRNGVFVWNRPEQLGAKP